MFDSRAYVFCAGFDKFVSHVFATWIFAYDSWSLRGLWVSHQNLTTLARQLSIYSPSSLKAIWASTTTWMGIYDSNIFIDNNTIFGLFEMSATSLWCLSCLLIVYFPLYLTFLLKSPHGFILFLYFPISAHLPLSPYYSLLYSPPYHHHFFISYDLKKKWLASWESISYKKQEGWYYHDHRYLLRKL